jgi:hypothetical protein
VDYRAQEPLAAMNDLVAQTFTHTMIIIQVFGLQNAQAAGIYNGIDVLR